VHFSGGIKIGNLSFIGIGSTIIQGIKVGKNVTIGAGSVVIKNVQDNMTVVGNPAIQIRKK
jgi:acetyltransferase-like isoleucine patch superfamily enzyme